MERISTIPRIDWQKKVEADGLVWHTPDGERYWNESTYYEFKQAEYEKLKSASETVYGMLLKAGDRIIEENLFDKFGIPSFAVPYLKETWNNEVPCLNYGRFDFGYNGDGSPKLFEFNCDTPTTLLEASVIQWNWKEEKFPQHDQMNMLHESLTAKWADIKPYLNTDLVHFTCDMNIMGEDVMNAAYMAEIAKGAGLDVKMVAPRDIGWDGTNFCDVDNEIMSACFKLYPWEWMLRDEFGKNIIQNNTNWLEPIWKMMWSNKAILPLLWEMYPNNEYLLESSFEPLVGEHIVKPIFGREGSGIHFSNESTSNDVDNILGKNIYQRKFDIKETEGGYPILGGWIVDGEFAGLGIREGEIITGNGSRFVPHILLNW